MDPNHIRLSDSAMRDYATCPKRFFYARIERLYPKERVKVFDVGSLGHTGCASYLHPKNLELDQTARYVTARNAIKEHFETLKAEGAGKDVLDEALHVFPVILRRKRTSTVLSVEQWWEMEIPVDEILDSDGLVIQAPFTIQLVGKCDGISIDQNALFIEEHKFISAMGFGDAKMASYQKSRQTKLYVLLAQANLKTDKVVRGVHHNFFLKKKEPDLRECTTIVGPKDLKRVTESVILTAREIRRCILTNTWREEMNACYGDWKPCPYARLCEFGDNEEIRRENFKPPRPEAKFDALNASKQSSAKTDIPAETGVDGRSGVDG